MKGRIRQGDFFQSEIEKKKQEEERLDKRVAELESENRKMREPLEAARREMEELRKRADNYDKMKSLYEVRTILLFQPSLNRYFRVKKIN